MNIQPISAQTNFGAKNFRVPMNRLEYPDMSLGIVFSKKMFCAKEYSNPNAEKLYKQAQSAKTWKEKARLYNEMGHYKLLVYGTGIKGFIRKLLSRPKTFI